MKVTAPLEFALEQNFPNPFNPSTQITYTLAKDSEVTLSIYDMLGTKVAELVNAKQTAGSYMINFNAKILSSGVYIYRIDTGNFTASKKLILMK